MTEIIKNDIKIIVCKTCGISSDINKFQQKRKECIKCVSKKNNERLKEIQYYKKYYEDNKDVLLPKYIKYYADVVKPVRKIAVK